MTPNHKTRKPSHYSFTLVPPQLPTSPKSLMDSTKPEEELAFDFSPILKVYKDGRVERPWGTGTVPASVDENTGVSSKDVVIVPETNVSARLYLPKISDSSPKKLPVLVYYHGGAFCIGSAFSQIYHAYLNTLVAEANVVAVSVDYRLAPEHPLPAAYADSWAALQWIASHSNGAGSEPWLNDYADLDKVFVSGDSAGANIAHNMAITAQTEPEPQLPGVKLIGAVLVHPFFAGVDAVGSELNNLEGKAKVEKSWFFLCPNTSGCDDPLVNPVADPKFSSLGVDRVLIMVAEKDQFRDRGWFYQESLGKSGWKGVVEFMETLGEEHCFHLFNPANENAVIMLKRFASFINQEGRATSEFVN